MSLKNLLLITVSCVSLIGCGGGGSPSNTTSSAGSASNTTTPPTSSIQLLPNGTVAATGIGNGADTAANSGTATTTATVPPAGIPPVISPVTTPVTTSTPPLNNGAVVVPSTQPLTTTVSPTQTVAPPPQSIVTNSSPPTSQVSPPATFASPNTVGVADTTAMSLAQGLPTGANGNAASIGRFAAQEMNSALTVGLKIWRTQRIDINGINKGACANCHSSDGFELAMWDFHDDDVRRRAHIDGVNPTDRENLVKYFAALRQKYNISALKSVLNDRPFQPKGQAFAGASKAERDLAFATQSLKVVAPTLYSGDIDTIPKAIQAKEELRVSNPLSMKIGILMPRISEDCFRGKEHCSANDWMADLPRIPKPENAAEWFAINDVYIADPTDANLRAVLVATDNLTVPWLNPGQTSPGAAATLGTDKFKSMQILQHQLRRQQLGLLNPSQDQNPLAPVAGFGQKRPNAPFLVGDFSFNKDGPTWNHASDMPIFVRKSLGETSARALTDDDIEAEKARMSMPWWYTGFIFDANLGTGTNTEYFLAALSVDPQGGYPFHRFYAIGKHGAIVNDRRAGTLAQVAAYNVAFAKPAWKTPGSDDLPRLFYSPEARAQYRKMEMSWTLMWMLLMKEQLQQSGISSLTKDFDIDLHLCAASGVPSLRDWVSKVTGLDGARAAFAFNLYNELNAMGNCGLAPFTSSYISGNGSGMTIDWYKGSGDEFNGKSTFLLNSQKVATRIEPIMDFPGREDGLGYFSAWAQSAGISVVEGGEAFSSRGTGSVIAPVTGTYEFVLSGGFGRLTVAGTEVFREFRDNEDLPLASKLHNVVLQGGQRYPIVFERHGYAPGGTQINWRTLDGKLPSQKIPSSQLLPN